MKIFVFHGLDDNEDEYPTMDHAIDHENSDAGTTELNRVRIDEISQCEDHEESYCTLYLSDGLQYIELSYDDKEVLLAYFMDSRQEDYRRGDPS